MTGGGRLLWRVLAIQLLVIVTTIGLVWLAIDTLAVDYFVDLMRRYGITPTVAHEMFVESVHRALLWATLGALALAAVLSLILTRRVLAPLAELGAVSREIARGHYDRRVPPTGRGEIGELADTFNRMAESLERTETLRRSMVVDVAHELRTPLTNLRGYLEAVEDGVLPPSPELLRQLQEETMRLVKLVESMLHLARAGAAVPPPRQTLPAGELVLQGLELFRSRFAAKGIDVTVDVDDRLELEADRDGLAQVVHNLLENAWRYTPDGGRVTLVVQRRGEAVETAVVNSGEGIDEADLPFVFERFYRGEKSRSRRHGGAGIGLAIVRELIEAHGGQVGAQSTPGGPTRVWFRLPAGGAGTGL